MWQGSAMCTPDTLTNYKGEDEGEKQLFTL